MDLRRFGIVSALWTLLVLVCAGLVTPAAAATPSPYPPPVCAQLSVSSTSVHPGETVTVSGTAFAPNTALTLIMESTPVVLGHVTTNAAGAFSTRVTIPSNASGSHVITVQGDTSGCPVQSIQVVVSAGVEAARASRGLSFTGVHIAELLALALGLLGIGAVVNRAGHRRQRRSRHSAR